MQCTNLRLNSNRNRCLLAAGQLLPMTLSVQTGQIRYPTREHQKRGPLPNGVVPLRSNRALDARDSEVAQ
jgi:hypothetical protein